MRLLYTLTCYPPAMGGAQLHQHLLAQQLKQQHQLQVCTYWNYNRTDWLLGTTVKAFPHSVNYTIEDIPVHCLSFSALEKLQMMPYIPLYYPFMSFALPAISAPVAQRLLPYAQAANLIHNVRIGREGLTYASWKLAQRLDIPFVFTPVHHPRWVGWRYREYLKLYQRADAVITLTQVEKQILIGLGVKAEKITVTGIGPVLAPEANPQGFLQNYGIQGPMVLFVGQHYPYKGYQQLLAATQLVWKQVPDAEFVFIGPPVALSEQVYAAFPDRRIHRLGLVDLQEKTDAIAACTLLCVPSSQESFGGAYTEAWSFARPVVGCAIPAVSEVITEGEDGYLVAQEPSAIADRICDLLLNPARATAMGKAGQQKVATHFSWQSLAAKTEQVYQRTLQGGH